MKNQASSAPKSGSSTSSSTGGDSGSAAAAPIAQEEAPDEEDFGELESVPGYRFYAPDTKDNVRFDIDVSSMVEGARPTIRAATIEKLVERMTHEKWPGKKIIN